MKELGDHGRLKRILGPKGSFKNFDVCVPGVEGDGSDALIAEGSGEDVCPHGHLNPDAVIVSRVFETA